MKTVEPLRGQHREIARPHLAIVEPRLVFDVAREQGVMLRIVLAGRSTIFSARRAPRPDCRRVVPDRRIRAVHRSVHAHRGRTPRRRRAFRTTRAPRARPRRLRPRAECRGCALGRKPGRHDAQIAGASAARAQTRAETPRSVNALTNSPAAHRAGASAATASLGSTMTATPRAAAEPTLLVAATPAAAPAVI